MTRNSKLMFKNRMKAIEERVKALEATPRVREAMTAAGFALPATPPKPRTLLRSASSLWPTMVRKPGRPKAT